MIIFLPRIKSVYARGSPFKYRPGQVFKLAIYISRHMYVHVLFVSYKAFTYNKNIGLFFRYDLLVFK